MASLLIGAAATFSGIQSGPLGWACFGISVILLVVAVLTFEPVSRRLGWGSGSPPVLPPPLAIHHDKEGTKDLLTFRALSPLTKVIIEPFGFTEGRIFMDPNELSYLHPDRPITCTAFVEVGPPGRPEAIPLRTFIEDRPGGKHPICVRFTDALGIRWRIPFHLQIKGVSRQIEWIPGTVERASPDW